MGKLTDIQAELKAPKNQYNNFGKYSYRSCEDILEAIKPLLVKHDCALVISDKVHDCSIGAYIEATADLYHNDKPIGAVSAQAGIEKAGGMALPQAFGSASSYARKYALNGLFLIDDTKDADATNTHDKAPSKPVNQQTKTEAVELLAAAATLDDLAKAWKSVSAELKKNEDVIGLKDARKEELKPTK